MKRLDSSDGRASAQVTPARVHGGTDALGAPRFDFSTNSNACGPCPQALAAVQQADASRYPDASYVALRAALSGAIQSDVELFSAQPPSKGASTWQNHL
jgi:histidinol-phosphate/aromatic aminotransferase/cobyric acid decarboxylase-like protein